MVATIIALPAATGYARVPGILMNPARLGLFCVVKLK
jgi:hypothetical protein